MGAIENIYEDLDADVSEEEFRNAVEQKVEQMGGLADEETAAMLIAHEVGENDVETIADIAAGMEEAKFVGKILRVGELRTFERDDENDGQVVNLELADESGSVRVALWDEQATAAVEELESGQVVRVKGRPKDGPRGLEVSADRLEVDEETTVEVEVGTVQTADGLSLGQEDVTLRGIVLETGSIRTFSRDDGSEGRVANLVVGDETGRVRVTLWDDQAERAEALDSGTSIELVDGYVREREGGLELHVGSHGAVTEIDEDITYVPDTTDIDDVEIGDTVDIGGVIRSADPKRTFDRDDGSEGQVRNVRLQDGTGDLRVALWGEKADADLAPGDEVLIADVDIEDGWQDDVEASANWSSTVSVLESQSVGANVEQSVNPQDDVADDTDATDRGGVTDGATVGAATGDESGNTGLSAFTKDEDDGDEARGETGDDDTGATPAEESGTAAESKHNDGEEIEVTGTVVQTGEPLMLDTDEETYTVETGVDVHLGERITVRGRVSDGRIDATEIL